MRNPLEITVEELFDLEEMTDENKAKFICELPNDYELKEEDVEGVGIVVGEFYKQLNEFIDSLKGLKVSISETRSPEMEMFSQMYQRQSNLSAVAKENNCSWDDVLKMSVYMYYAVLDFVAYRNYAEYKDFKFRNK